MFDSFDVSVLMSVYKGASDVKKTMDSVLLQQGVEFEFVIVSDGADQSVLDVIADYDDSRIRLIKQSNQGLTKALVNGCQQIKSPFIARIDAGDEMHESRLKKQVDVLLCQHDIGMVGSWVEIETIESDFLYAVKHTAQELDSGLRSIKGPDLISPFHACVMFRKSVYEKVGGYRTDFYFAQDMDLWSRMIEYSNISIIEQVLTTGIFSVSGISGRYRHYQTEICNVIANANRLRQAGISDDAVLTQAKKLRPSKHIINKAPNNAKFDALYFLASVLSKNKSINAKKYWWQAFKVKPLNIKVWIKGGLSLRH